MVAIRYRQPVAGRFLQNVAELTRLESAWNELCLAQPRPNPMLSWDWVTTWWKVYVKPGLSLSVWVHEKDGKLKAAFPLYRTETEKGAMFHLTGTGEAEADAVCSDYLGALWTPPAEEFREELAADLTSLLADPRDSLLLTDLAENDPFNEGLPDCFRRHGLAILGSPGPVCPYLPLPDTIEEFFSSLSPHFQSQLRQNERALRKLGESQIRWVRKAEDLESFWSDLVRLHQKRSASLGRPGVFRSPLFSTFHREIAERFFERGWLNAAVLEAGGKVLAATYAFRMAGTVFMYQSGIDPDLPTKARAGLLLHAEMIREAIRNEDREYDFMRGDDPYKRRFTKQTRTLMHLEAGQKTLGRTFGFMKKSARERLANRLPPPLRSGLRKVRRIFGV